MPNNDIKEFVQKSGVCACALGLPDAHQLNYEFARWILDTFEEARKTGDSYFPELVIKIM